MHIGILGINHKSADLPLREKIAQACARLFGADSAAYLHFTYILLSTCNRTELYFHSDDAAQTHTYLLNALRGEIKEEFEHRIYSYFGSDCFLHLARVTAGVDSAVLGETEIQGQVKRAYETAQASRSLPKELHFLFQKCLKIGKEVRSHPQFFHELPSLEETIFNSAFEVFGDLREKSILFVGLSEINRKIMTGFRCKGLRKMTLCNRSDSRAQEIADLEKVETLAWEDLTQWVKYDLTIFGTACPSFLVGSEVEKDIWGRKLIVDLSVPRNVDPKMGRHPYIKLLNIDHLNRLIYQQRKIKITQMAKDETHYIARAVEKQTALFKLKELHKSYHVLSCAS